MFRSTLGKIKKVCRSAVVTSTSREKSSDGRFSRFAAPEVRKKHHNKTKKFEDQKQKCLEIIDDCFAPLQTFNLKEEIEEVFSEDIRKVQLERQGQAEKENSEKIACQCFGEPATIDKTKETSENESYGRAVERLQSVDEMKRVETPLFKRVEEKISLEIVKAESIIRRVKGYLKAASDIYDNGDGITKDESKDKSETHKPEEINMNKGREYSHNLEMQHIKEDLRTINKFKDTLLYDDLKSIEDHYTMQADKTNKKVQTPEHSVNSMNYKNHKTRDGQIENLECLKVQLQGNEFISAKDEIRKTLEQEEQVQYREVLQTAELHYKQLENVELNKVAEEEQQKSNITESQVVQENLNQLSSEEETEKLHETERLNYHTVKEDPSIEQENVEPLSAKGDKEDILEPDNFKVNVEPRTEQANSETVSSREEKVELHETDKLKMNSVKEETLTDQENFMSLSFKEENREVQSTEKEELNQIVAVTETDNKKIKSYATNGEINELDNERNIISATHVSNVNNLESKLDTGKEFEPPEAHYCNTVIEPKISEKNQPKKAEKVDQSDYATQTEPLTNMVLTPKELNNQSELNYNNLQLEQDNFCERKVIESDEPIRGKFSWLSDCKLPDKVTHNEEATSQSTVSNPIMPTVFKADPIELNNEQKEPEKEDDKIHSNVKEVSECNDLEPEINSLLHYTAAQVPTNQNVFEKTEQNNYTPQIDDEMFNNKEIEKELTDEMCELNNYSPQIYTQTLHFKQTDKEQVELRYDEHNQEPNAQMKPDRLQLLHFTNFEMTEQDHYSPQIYMDAFLEAQRKLGSGKILHDEEAKIEQHSKQSDDDVILCQESNNLQSQKQGVQQLDYTDVDKPALNVVNENETEPIRERTSNINFAHVNTDAIGQSLNRMLHAKPKSTSPKGNFITKTQADDFEAKLLFDDAIKPVDKIEKALKMRNIIKDSKKVEKNQAVADQVSKDSNAVTSTRDAATSLIKELRGNIKERTPPNAFNEIKYSDHWRSESPMRRNRRKLYREINALRKQNYYDKIATEWLKNEESKVSKEFDEIASQYRRRYRSDKTTRPGSGRGELECRATGPFRTSNVDHNVFSCKTIPLTGNEEPQIVCKPPLAYYKSEIVGVKPRNSVGIVDHGKGDEDTIILEGKIGGMCIASSETTPLFHNEEHVLMGDMSRGPLHNRNALEKKENIELTTDYNYHKQAIMKLISNITHLRGFLDEGKGSDKDSLNSFHDRQMKRHAILYKAMVEAVTKVEQMVNKDEAVERFKPTDSATNYYSAEDVSVHNVNSTNENNIETLLEPKDQNAAAKITLNPSAPYTDLCLKDQPPNDPKPNSSTKNLKLTTTVFNTDLSATFNSTSSEKQRTIPVERLIKAVRNYSQGSKSNAFDSKKYRDGSVSKQVDNNSQVIPEMPQIHVQWDCSTQTEQTIQHYNSSEEQRNAYLDRHTTNVDQEENNATNRENTTKIKVDQIDLIDPFTAILPVQHEPKNKTMEEQDKEQQIERSVAYYVKTDVKQEDASAKQCSEPSYEIDTTEQTLPHVEQISWEPAEDRAQDADSIHVIKESKPTENISEQLSQQEKGYRNCLNHHEKFFQYYEPTYEHARQQYNNSHTFKEETIEQLGQKHKVNASKTDELQTNEHEMPCGEQSGRHRYYCNGPQQNNQSYGYAQQQIHYFYPLTKRAEEKQDQGQNYQLHDFNHQPNCLFYGPSIIPPPSARFVPSLQIIQTPSMTQALSLDCQNCQFCPQHGGQNMQNNQTHNAIQKKFNQTQGKQNDQIAVSPEMHNEAEEPKLPKEQEHAEPKQQYNNNYYIYQNPVAHDQSETEKQLKNYYYDISEQDQANYHCNGQPSKDVEKSEKTDKYQNQYHDQQSLEADESNHEYQDASSHYTPPGYIQTHKNCNCYHYEYYKSLGINMYYPSPYTQLSISPLDHKPNETCEHCCAEDTSRPNELKTEELKMKGEEKEPKPEPETRFAKPKIKKRKSRSRGRGALERGTEISKELELNTVTLPSLDGNLKLSELLDRVRKRNRIISMIEVLKPYDPLQMVRCNDKDPPKPPTTPKTPISPGNCPKCNPEPCKIPCPPQTNPCDKSKPKDPCNRCSTAEKVTIMLFVGKKAEETARLRKTVSKSDSTDDTKGKPKSGVAQMIVAALMKLKKYIEGSDTSLNSDSDRSLPLKSLTRAEMIAERFRPKRKEGKHSPLEILKDGKLQARKHVTSRFPMTCEVEDVFYDA